MNKETQSIVVALLGGLLVSITLSGSVLFASNKADLLPEARTRLSQVAAALLETKERHLDIEGYTDSQGNDASNVARHRSRSSG